MKKRNSPVFVLPHEFGISSDNGAIINAAIASNVKRCGKIISHTVTIKPDDLDVLRFQVITEHEPIECESN